MMKAITYTRYGSPEVLQLEEVEKPVPKAHEILIKTRASTVTSADWRARSLNMPRGFGLMGRLVFGITKPRQPVLGSELSGVIESVGDGVQKFKVGDKVFAFTGAKMGCNAEYHCMSEDGLIALKPGNLTYEEAAALSFGGTTALDFFRRGKIKKGDKILINGASGGVGTAAIQIARYYGAEVTAVCSTYNKVLVKSLGASKVVDYTKEDFTNNGEKYDIIMDTVGTAPFSRSKYSLRSGGRLLLVLGGLSDLLQAPWQSMSGTNRIIAGPTNAKADDMNMIAMLAGENHFIPVIDRRYPLAQIADAHIYVDRGHKRGNVVLNM